MSGGLGKTLYDKLWDAHVVREDDDGTALIYIDRQLLHEVTSPQAFEGLKMANRQPWRIDANLATLDHNVPTTDYKTVEDILDPISKIQVQTLGMNAEEFGITVFGIGDIRQGIVHVVGPEEGATLPGMTLVCGDSHTATHGALAALAHGVGTSEVEHVLATQCLIQRKMKNMRVNVEGYLQKGVTPKDVVLALIGKIGTAGGNGHAMQFTGQVLRDMSIEGRMTICNMAIEAGARVGLTGVDDKTIEYVKGKPFAPKGDYWNQAVESWRKLRTDENAVFDKVIEMDGSLIEPQVSWGTTPEMVTGISGYVPDPKNEKNIVKSAGIQRALDYMGLQANMAIKDIPVEYIFIGSCTNARIEDFRAAAKILKGHKISPLVEQALAVPGSGLVKKQAEKEGLDKIFIAAGFEWRNPGCSMCLAMNDDKLPDGKHCASTSNRNFEGRQGAGGRTHLVSPEMAAAASIAGHFVDVREMLNG
jgi:3-isopropylmalate/(R)-2-methylmalate dehydratase large subunit